jgi:hypothetical protein
MTAAEAGDIIWSLRSLIPHRAGFLLTVATTAQERSEP